MLVYLRLAQKADLPAIMTIIDQAKTFLKNNGSTQWQSGYPDPQTIADDIVCKQGWVLVCDNQIAGYAAIPVGPDPHYAKIDGAWQNNKDVYAVIHRMALSSVFRGQHLSDQLINQAIGIFYARGVHNFRVDTGFQNKIVQHLATSHGFKKRGIIKVDDPIEPRRLAYELNL
jgi:predicted GNAT family N-acyltransferase